MFRVSVFTGSEMSSPVSASVPSAIASGAGMSARRNSGAEYRGRLGVEIIKGMFASRACHGRHEILQHTEHAAILGLRVELLVVRILPLRLFLRQVDAALLHAPIDFEHL